MESIYQLMVENKEVGQAYVLYHINRDHSDVIFSRLCERPVFSGTRKNNESLADIVKTIAEHHDGRKSYLITGPGLARYKGIEENKRITDPILMLDEERVITCPGNNYHFDNIELEYLSGLLRDYIDIKKRVKEGKAKVMKKLKEVSLQFSSAS